jgi:hypothetical protein
LILRRHLAVLALLPALLAAAPVEPAPEWRYTIRPGDTLIGIGQTYLRQPGDWRQLQRLNLIANPYRLMPGSGLRIPLALLRHQPAPARAHAVSGEVSFSLPGGTPAALAAGASLPGGTAIRTHGTGTAVIEFADGARLVLQPNSSLLLDTLSVYAGGGMVDTRVRLQQGRAELSANPARQPGRRLEVITPSAVAAVRGTRFRVAADAAATREETLAGEVAVAAQQVEVAVGAAQGTLAEAGKPPSPPVALLGAPDVSALPARFERYPLSFPLPALAGAQAFSGQVAPDAGFNAILLDKTTPGPVLAFAELPDGNYHLRLRGVDALGLMGLDGLHAFEVDAHPFAPLLGQPAAGGRVRVPQPTLDWTRATEASRYRLQLARDAGFGARLVDETQETQRFQPALTQSGEYFWRVASIDRAGEQGPFSEARRFSYVPAPGAPDLSGTGIRVKDDTLAIDLPALPEGQHYEVIFARDAGLKDVLWQGRPDGLALALPRPRAGTYYLGARGVEADGTAGPFSTQAIPVPARPWWPALFLLLPVLL